MRTSGQQPKCPHCGSTRTISKGWVDRKQTKKRYLCKDCGKYFSVPVQMSTTTSEQVVQAVQTGNTNRELTLEERVQQLEQAISQVIDAITQLAELLNKVVK